VLLRDEDEEIRRCAATALRELDAREAALPLRALLRDPNERVIAAAARALGSFGAREAIPEILPLLRHEDGDVRAVAIGALGALEAKAAAEPLLAILRDPGYGGRLDVAEALAQIGGRAAIPALVGVLSEGDGMARVEVIQAFARMGAREAVPDLLRLLKDEDAAVVKAAVEALVDLGASECVPRVARLLGDPDDSLVELAVGALEVFGAKGAVRDVARGLACELPATRERLLKILAAADGREAIPAILPLLGDPALRDLAAEILCRWGGGEGVGVLLEQEREFGLLNAAAEPDLWKRLQAPTPCLAGDLRQQIDLLADLAGLPIVEWPDDADGEEEVRSHPEATIFDTLRALLDQENLHMILTPEGILAVDGAHALEYWRGWWESRRPR
jgi:HEAT repeat protein